MDRSAALRSAFALALFLGGPGIPAGLRASGPETADGASADLAFSWSDLAREIALHVVPENYRDDRHWGRQERVQSGVRVRTKGGQVRFESREQHVNHGFWRRFSMTLLNPEKTFQLEIRNLRQTPERSTRFDLFIQVRGRCETQFAVWTYGVKGLNGAVESDVTVQALVDCSFGIDAEFQEQSLFPVFVVRPEFHSIRLKLTDVDTRKIGLVGGWVAEELGNGTRKAFEDLLQTQEKPLLARIRKSVEKNNDRLRLDPAAAARIFSAGHGK